MRNPIVTVCVLVLVLMGRSAYAQEQGQVGLAMGYPSNIGVVWHATDRIAIRPAISFAHGWSDSTTESESETFFLNPSAPGPLFSTVVLRSTTSSENWTVGADLSVLFYLSKWDNVSTYLAPTYSYRRSSSTSESVTEVIGGSLSGLPPEVLGPRTIETRSSSHAGSAMFGVQFAPHRRFSAFGELGFRYTASGTPFNTISDQRREASSGSVGTSTAVGVTFYFN